MKRNVVIVVVVLAIACLALGGGYIAGRSRKVTNSTPVIINTASERVYYPTQTECEAASGKYCEQVMCDYAPEGKTIEEVCGADYKKGYWSAKTNE